MLILAGLPALSAAAFLLLLAAIAIMLITSRHRLLAALRGPVDRPLPIMPTGDVVTFPRRPASGFSQPAFQAARMAA